MFSGLYKMLKYADVRKGEVKRNLSDIRKARKMLGFEPECGLIQGLEKHFYGFSIIIRHKMSDTA